MGAGKVIFYVVGITIGIITVILLGWGLIAYLNYYLG